MPIKARYNGEVAGTCSEIEHSPRRRPIKPQANCERDLALEPDYRVKIFYEVRASVHSRWRQIRFLDFSVSFCVHLLKQIREKRGPLLCQRMTCFLQRGDSAGDNLAKVTENSLDMDPFYIGEIEGRNDVIDGAHAQEATNVPPLWRFASSGTPTC